MAVIGGALDAVCGGGSTLAKIRSAVGGFDSAGLHWSQRPMRAVSPDDIPIVLCARCGGARTGHTNGLVKGCRDMHDKESRLKPASILQVQVPHSGFGTCEVLDEQGEAWLEGCG